MHAHVGWNVARLRLTDQRVNQQAVYDFQRALGDVFMRPVNRVARLERHDRFPALVGKGRPCLCSGVRRYFHEFWIMPWCQHFEVTGQAHVALRKHDRHAGMGLLGRAIDLLALFRLVVGVLLLDGQDRQGAVGVVGQHNRLAEVDSCRRWALSDRARDRHGPGQPAGQPHACRRCCGTRPRRRSP